MTITQRKRKSERNFCFRVGDVRLNCNHPLLHTHLNQEYYSEAQPKHPSLGLGKPLPLLFTKALHILPWVSLEICQSQRVLSSHRLSWVWVERSEKMQWNAACIHDSLSCQWFQIPISSCYRSKEEEDIKQDTLYCAINSESRYRRRQPMWDLGKSSQRWWYLSSIPTVSNGYSAKKLEVGVIESLFDIPARRTGDKLHHDMPVFHFHSAISPAPTTVPGTL